MGVTRAFHVPPGSHHNPLTSGYPPHHPLLVTVATWKWKRLLKERQLVPSRCSADRCGRRRRQLVPIWRTDAGTGKVSHQTVFKCHSSFLSPTPQNATASAGSCPLLCSLSRVALGAKEAERENREWSPCFSLLPTLGALLNHSLLEGRALCTSVMGPRPLCECREPLSFPGLCLCFSNSIFWHGHVCPRMFRCMCTCVTRLEGRD